MTLLRYRARPAVRRPVLGAAISKLLVLALLACSSCQQLVGAFAIRARSSTSSTHQSGCRLRCATEAFKDDPPLSVLAKHPSRRNHCWHGLPVLFMTNRGDENEDEDPDGSGDAMLFGEAGLLVALSVVATTLGAATLYSLMNPLVDFDVDLYLSINSALNGGGVGGVADGVGGGGEIVELPALSPAEQIVGAFFGPPRR